MKSRKLRRISSRHPATIRSGIMKKTWILSLVVITLTGFMTAHGRVERAWVSLLPDMPEGSPIEMVLTDSNEKQSQYVLQVPGFWISPIMYGDEQFARIEFPEVKMDGLGFPRREGERGWYDFPVETGYPLLDETRYRNAFTLSVPLFLYPSEAMDKPEPENAAEMEALGIDPTGARPGIHALRGLLAVHPETRRSDLDIQINYHTAEVIQLPAPLVPAGYTGSDRLPDDGDTGYIPPEIIDWDFYKNFRGPYTGTEFQFTPTSQAGRFAVSELRHPMYELIEIDRINIGSLVEILVEYHKGPTDPGDDCPYAWDHWIFKRPFINGEALRAAMTARGQKILDSRSARYLILTLEEYRSTLLPLAWWKYAKGLYIDFAFVGDGPNDDVTADRDAINDYLEAYFKEYFCHGVYVLIAGDRDAIPSGVSDHINDFPNHNIFGGDSDHVYQVLGDDLFPSLYVGRLSVDSSDELRNQVSKILDYERSPPPGSWPARVTLAANSEDSDGDKGVTDLFPSKYALAIEQTAEYEDYVITPDFNVLHAGAASEEDDRAINQDVIDAINEGSAHVLYRGHGGNRTWVSGWDGSSDSGASFWSHHVDQLENDVLPIVYSIACLNSRQRANRFLADEWMQREDYGAVAHYGATTASYTAENHHRAKAVMRAIFEDQFTRLGPALGEVIHRTHAASGGGGAWRHNTFTYILHGCPELSIRLGTVLSGMNMVYRSSDDGTLIEVTDSESDSAAIATLVTVELVDGSRTNAFTNMDGQLLLDGVKDPSEIRTIHAHAGGHIYSREQVIPSLRTEMRIEFMDNVFVIRVDGEDREYLIEASDDLLSWETVTIITVSRGSGFYPSEEIGSGDAPAKRFYRAVPLP